MFLLWWQGPEYDAFIAAAKSEDRTQFLQTTSAEVVQLFMSPPFVGVHKPKPDGFSAFGMCWTLVKFTPISL